jgi:hypothetical protein
MKTEADLLDGDHDQLGEDVPFCCDVFGLFLTSLPL